MTNKPEENNNYKMTKPDVIKAAMNKASAAFEDTLEIQLQAFNKKMNSVGTRIDAAHIYQKDCDCKYCSDFKNNTSVFEREIWNKAIEAAAKLVDKDTRHDQAGYAFGPAMEIRKLKK